jgi:catechol 2,3-dioxygenase-like lactoylglutathione lyase family enzyme
MKGYATMTSGKRVCPMLNRLALLLALGIGTLAAQSQPAVVSVATFLHIVADVDQSIDFYRGLGLEITGHAVEPKLFDNPPVANMYGVPGQQYRAVVLKVPGLVPSLNIELVQWGEARKPEHTPVAEPGAITLILRRTQAANAGTTLHDPDGFPIQIVQADKPGTDLSISVSDVSRTAGVFSKVLGFKPEGDWFTVPGASTRIRLTKATSSAGLAIPFPSPGRGSVRLTAHDIAGMTAELTAAGLTVVTTGGAPVQLPFKGPQAIILREPSSFGLQLLEAK